MFIVDSYEIRTYKDSIQEFTHGPGGATSVQVVVHRCLSRDPNVKVSTEDDTEATVLPPKSFKIK